MNYIHLSNLYTMEKCHIIHTLLRSFPKMLCNAPLRWNVWHWSSQSGWSCRMHRMVRMVMNQCWFTSSQMAIRKTSVTNLKLHNNNLLSPDGAVGGMPHLHE
jgi:hypothetical protein